MNKEILKSIKVLYVEDENDVREFTTKTISAIVKSVVSAENGKVGLEKFSEDVDSFDLVVTDINMPKMGGLEMCAEIKKLNPYVPIVITSAHNDPNFLKKAIDVGVNAYAMKPVDLYQLIDSMIKAVEPFYLKKQLESINVSLEDKVEEATKKLRSILDAQENLVIVTDRNQINNVNKKFLEFFNVKNMEEFLEKYENLSSRFIVESGFFHLELLHEDQSWITYIKNLNELDRVVKIENIEGVKKIFKVNIDVYEHQEEHFVISLTDITELQEKSNLLEYQATHDTLTGVYNRQRFHDYFSKEIKRDKRYENYLSLIIFDIDFFKKFNDDFGHDVGDLVLKNISKIALSVVREHDSVVRWGGEEFIIILPETNLEGAKIVAEKLRSSIEVFKDERIPRQITASFGVTTMEEDDTEHTFVKRADEALYKAKHNGRNRVEVSI